MNKTQQRQMLKGTCFNKLMKLYHPKANWSGDSYNRESSYREQRDEEAQYIVEQYIKKLEKLNNENVAGKNYRSRMADMFNLIKMKGKDRRKD